MNVRAFNSIVDVVDEIAAEGALFLDKENFEPLIGDRQSGGHPCGASADNKTFLNDFISKNLESFVFFDSRHRSGGQFLRLFSGYLGILLVNP